MLAWLDRQPDKRATLRALTEAGGATGSYAVRSGVEELVREGHVAFDGDVVLILSHPVEGGVYDRPGQFRRMEILAVGTFHGKTAMAALMHSGDLVIQDIAIWPLVFENPRVPIEPPRLFDHVKYLSDYRGSGRWLHHKVQVFKISGEIVLTYTNGSAKAVHH